MTILCSRCFNDVGLQIEADKIGTVNSSRCPNCGRLDGKKLTRQQLNELASVFFHDGSFYKTQFGGASRLQINEHHFGADQVHFFGGLKHDAELIEKKLKAGIFYYGPALWRLGEITPLQKLRKTKTRPAAIKKIISKFPDRFISSQCPFFRVRIGLTEKLEKEISQYDSPPTTIKRNFGRLDSASLAVLYGSEDLEICIHECRVTIADECFVARLRPVRDLHMLDLTSDCVHLQENEFESIGLAMRFLFSAELHSYEITQEIAKMAAAMGYDGIYYPSYFSVLKQGVVPNIALFGHPIAEGKLKVECINRARLKAANYEISMGPIFS